jgi:hypothetical protein
MRALEKQTMVAVAEQTVEQTTAQGVEHVLYEHLVGWRGKHIASELTASRLDEPAPPQDRKELGDMARGQPLATANLRDRQKPVLPFLGQAQHASETIFLLGTDFHRRSFAFYEFKLDAVRLF